MSGRPAETLARVLALNGAIQHRREQRPAWTPSDVSSSNECDRCGAHVSKAFHRQWCDNQGYLDGCRECLPRSVRFGEDVYGRDKDDVEFSL